MKRILLVFGTRPEAIKLCPVYRALVRHEGFDAKVCVTGQHRDMLDQVLGIFDVRPDFDLNLMQPGQTLSQTTSRAIAALEPVLQEVKPDLVVVQGDTTTTLCGALAGFYARTPVAHVEAGLRTWDLAHPFPEELNRILTTKLTTAHFAPTEGAADNLRRESVPESSIFVTGNTGLDAALHVSESLAKGLLRGADTSYLDPGKRMILVTAHRRENFGDGIRSICEALCEIAGRGDVQIVYPVHPNPNIAGVARKLLSGVPNVTLLDPQDYVPFIDLMRRSHLILTDSGGVQEEAPSLGKPVLVLRTKTERPEAVEAGTVRLVGTDRERIVAECARLLDDPEFYQSMAWAHNPYGDGRASERIVGHIETLLHAGQAIGATA